MRAGNNLHAKFTRLTYPNDDEVGGALPSGTVVYASVEGRIQDSVPAVEFALQGISTNKVSTAEFYPGTLDIREKDDAEVISPPNHPYFGITFRVNSVQKPNYHPADPRGFLLVTMVRNTKHGDDYQ
jgi:hypothetical protein